MARTHTCVNTLTHACVFAGSHVHRRRIIARGSFARHMSAWHGRHWTSGHTHPLAHAQTLTSRNITTEHMHMFGCEHTHTCVCTFADMDEQPRAVPVQLRKREFNVNSFFRRPCPPFLARLSPPSWAAPPPLLLP